MVWTPEHAWTLEQMWLWGIPSGVISRNMGNLTRNAVMGRVNRAGLMGRGGERLGRELEGAEIDPEGLRETAAELMREPYDAGNALHRHAEIAVACLLVGHSVRAVAKATGHDRGRVEATIAAMHERGVWKDGEAPPSAWWHHEEGRMAFMLDMMATEGLVVAHRTDRHGGRAYSRPDAAGTDEQA